MSSNLSGSAAITAVEASEVHQRSVHGPPSAAGAPVDPPSTEDLVARAKLGEMAAFEQLVLTYQCRAFALAYGLVRDENDAREVVQEAFLRAFLSLQKFEGNSAFFTWLFRIVTNLSIDHMRRPSRREVEMFDSHELETPSDLSLANRYSDSDPAAALQNAYICRQIQEGIERLPPHHRGVIVMREVKGMSYEDMARSAGVSKGTIMSRLFHARRKLQQILEECYLEHFGSVPQRRVKERQVA